MKHYWNLDITSAEKCFSTMLKKNPLSIKALCGEVLCGHRYSECINMKEYSNELIENQLKFISQLNPNPNEYIYYLCLAVVNQDIESINKCIEINPNMAEAIVFKDLLLIEQKQNQEAIQFGQKALEMSENNVYILRALGYIYIDINNDVSISFLLKSLKINPKQYVTYPKQLRTCILEKK